MFGNGWGLLLLFYYPLVVGHLVLSLLDYAIQAKKKLIYKVLYFVLIGIGILIILYLASTFKGTDIYFIAIFLLVSLLIPQVISFSLSRINSYFAFTSIVWLIVLGAIYFAIGLLSGNSID